MTIETIGTPWMWLGFLGFVLIMLALDLGVFHRRPHDVSFKEAGGWSLVWVALAGVFCSLVYVWFGSVRALEFATGYVIEKALAVDNIFVFAVVFSAFGIPSRYQHRVLFWGILGALVLRAAFILAGGAFLQRFHWAMYVFGAILVLTGIKMVVQKEHTPHLENNILVRAVRRFYPVTPTLEGQHFFVVRDGRRWVTPLFLALVAVEFSDVIFAIDSIPAIFAVTTDPFIVFTSNIFAILGLRSLYFLLAGMLDRFAYLKYGLSAILVFVGTKMLIVGVYKIPILLSLAVIFGILAIALVVSWLKSDRGAGAAAGNLETPPVA